MSDDSTIDTINLQGAGLGPLKSPSVELTVVAYHLGGSSFVALSDGERLIVGRSASADLSVDAGGLSAQHAAIALEDGVLLVEDLGSTNGTHVKGQRIERVEAIAIGEPIMLGPVTVVAQPSSLVADQLLAVETHEAFERRLRQEVRRARHFDRGLAVLMMGLGSSDGEVSSHIPDVVDRLSPVEAAGLYSRRVLEVIVPEADAEQAAERARALLPHSSFVVGVALFPDASTSVDGLIERALSALSAARRSGQVEVKGEQVRERSRPAPSDGPIIKSPAMQRLYDTISRISRSPIPVLITGETGCGKEVLAHAVHEASKRREQPIICVNCAAIPTTLIESTLFGHEKGAFTGAEARKLGVFENAAGGTVFLDELGELPAAAQAALLRVLETGRFQRVGASDEIEVDVRVIAATHRDLQKMVGERAFREDLLFRLNAMTLDIPPLRERTEEILPLAERFLVKAAEQAELPLVALDEDAREALMRHRWPGNVRELRNAMARALAICDGTKVGMVDLPQAVQLAEERTIKPGTRRIVARPPKVAPPTPSVDVSDPVDFKGLVQTYERELITAALKATGWNKTQAARRLTMPLRTMAHKVKAYDLVTPDREA